MKNRKDSNTGTSKKNNNRNKDNTSNRAIIRTPGTIIIMCLGVGWTA